MPPHKKEKKKNWEGGWGKEKIKKNKSEQLIRFWGKKKVERTPVYKNISLEA